MRRAQIKMAETIAVLIIFFFLLMIGFSIYASLQQQYYQEKIAENAELEALQITQKASYLPELQCSIYGNQRSNCFDVQKAQLFFDMTHLPDEPGEVNTSLINRYYDILRHTDLYIEEVYPGNETYWIYNQTLSGNETQIKRQQVPVSLYDGSTDAYSIGVLHISYSYDPSET